MQEPGNGASKKPLDSLDSGLDEAQKEWMTREISYDECELALNSAKVGTAPGRDGLPYEVWKTLHARFIEDSRHEDRECFDVMKLLHALLTKVLSVRLAAVAPTLIHESQAGFVPGRKLKNHTQLARLMTDWAERTETNGVIIALDQEKAYDKIAHDYLWRVMEKFGLPASFTNTVQALYENAETSVLINGVLSRPYRVTRGVRQGDPLSCLLFNLAIEPLSAMIRKSDIQGIKIPYSREALKATLFADDTTTYLSEHDDFGVLKRVLDTWCGAAKARFNIAKTEAIPIGTPQYRAEVIAAYRATGTWKNLPQNARVAADGEPTRILGAWLGNNLQNCEIWSPKIEAIRNVLEKWSRSRPTLEGKRHVVQMFAGGMSQFLTTVQCMPKTVVSRLNAVIRNYLWNDRHSPPVRMEHMYLPVDKGGFNILDLDARNDAIDIMWLRDYLDFKNRPLWALLADDIFARTTATKCIPAERSLRINPFLQNWAPTRNKLPAELKALTDSAKKYGLRLEGRAFSRDIIRTMPLWDHAQADKTKLRSLSGRSAATRCLKTNHALISVGDFESFIAEQDDPTHSYGVNEHAPAKVGTPDGEHPEDYETRVHESAGETFDDIPEALVIFDRRVTTHGSLTDALRVFTTSSVPVCNDLPIIETDLSAEVATVATDGSCLNNGERHARAGAGVYYGPGHPANLSVRLPIELEQSNQTGEGVASLMAAKAADPARHLVQITDSKTVLESVTRYRQRNEDEGFIRQSNGALTQSLISALLARKAHTAFQWVKGHAGHPGNEAADALAGTGARKPDPDEVDMSIDRTLHITGAKLSTMTQELAYRAIRERKARKVDARTSTQERIQQILTDLEDDFDIRLSERNLWKSLKKDTVSREARQWIWTSIHDGFMIGQRWLRPNMSDEMKARATCRICGQTESMQHILFTCEAVGRQTIWGLLQSTWTSTGRTPYDPNWGNICGAACAAIRPNGKDRCAAAESLWAILAIESAHLIWKLRCERVIAKNGAEFTEREVTNRWYSTLNKRLAIDRRVVSLLSGKRKLLKATKLDAAWRPILEGLEDPSADWVADSGVLVGMKRGG
ncbi:hypothetical protein NUW54_g3267 [Trametes sanguinea]|uniref:Uncharacterized protein n=1 Tax=Trametes sanguinea TaxID=158606 RepID=A0ACC1Q3T4_9APHY|nr:hypothetical protein NUW54_g3267 [Trametes sanguinea]